MRQLVARGCRVTHWGHAFERCGGRDAFGLGKGWAMRARPESSRTPLANVDKCG